MKYNDISIIDKIYFEQLYMNIFLVNFTIIFRGTNVLLCIAGTRVMH